MKDRLPRKLVAVLYADIVGYSRMASEDEDGTHHSLKAALNLVTKSVEEYGGRVINYSGDAVLATFDAVVDALCCAATIQRNTGRSDDQDEASRKIQFRIGVNLGDVIEDGGDIFGDGVNIAARLEGLSDPGGICISEAVYAVVRNKPPFEYRDMGEQTLKNISDPVRVYRVHINSDTKIPPPERTTRSADKANPARWPFFAASIAVVVSLVIGVVYWISLLEPQNIQVPASQERLAIPDKPSIAVLPFINLSDDAKQEYFTDGMTEDLITDLSKISGLFVIARNSSFSFKGRQVKVRQVAEELGVRYVLEGSVRRAGDQVRINAQLIDATSGGHVWADRYDGSYDDVFALQDRMTAKIISALSLKLSPQDKVQLTKPDTASPEAYDEFLKGWELRWRVNRESYARAEQHFKKALEYDPEYARAHAGLALLYMQIWQQGWHQNSGLQSAGWHRARVHLEAAMSNPDTLTHSLRSTLQLHNRRYEKAISEARQAVALNPSSAEGHLVLAEALSYSGEHMEAIYNVEKAQRLDPNLPGSYLVVEGRALFDRMTYRAAVGILDKARQAIPDDTQPLIYQIAAYGHLGDTDYAGLTLVQLNNLLKSDNLPSFTLSALRNRFPYKSREALQHLRDGLSKGGVPEW